MELMVVAINLTIMGVMYVALVRSWYEVGELKGELEDLDNSYSKLLYEVDELDLMKEKMLHILGD